jgi:Rap1a immunity proteins
VVFATPRFYYLEYDQSTDDPLQRTFPLIATDSMEGHMKLNLDGHGNAKATVEVASKKQQSILPWWEKADAVGGASKKLATLLLSSALSFPMSAQAQNTEKLDGNKLLDSCEDVVKVMDNPGYKSDSSKFYFCLGYIQGFGAAMETHRTITSATFTEYKSKDFLGILFPNGVTNLQIARVIVKWLQDNPTKLHEDADMLMFVILRDAFPSPTVPKVAESTSTKQ